MTDFNYLLCDHLLKFSVHVLELRAVDAEHAVLNCFGMVGLCDETQKGQR